MEKGHADFKPHEVKYTMPGEGYEKKVREHPREGLCFRCESRALFMERGIRPRFECGVIESAKYSCYMYRPVCPVTTICNDDGTGRPRLGPTMLSQREIYHGKAEGMVLNLRMENDQATVFWTPKDEENEEADD